jgi:uncharacterized protein YdaU (DUF1376 family)
MAEDGAYMRMVDWCYTHERPLPLTEREVCKIARATSRHEREAAIRVLREFFTLADDGWHQSRIDRELLAFTRKVERETNHPHSARERSERARAKRADLFKRATACGLSTVWNMPTAELEQQLKEHLASGIERAHRAVTEREGMESSPRHILGTDIQYPLTSAVTAAAVPVAAQDYAAAARDAAKAAGVADPLSVGRAVRQLKAAGMSGFNTADPRFVALVQRGVTDDEWRLTAAEAVLRQKPFGWLLGTIAGRQADVANGYGPGRASNARADARREQVAALTPSIAAKPANPS